MHQHPHTAPALVVHPSPPFRTEGQALLLAAPLADPPRSRSGQAQGGVVRITYVREYRVIDEETLLRAAVERGWQPLPASELGEDDPQDLLGAVMALTGDPDVAGTRTLEYQGSAEFLRPGDRDCGGDERAQRKAAPVVTRFSHRRHPPFERTGPAPRDRTPDFAALFASRDRPCDGGCANCGERGRQLTPRSADLLHTVLVVLADQAYDDAQYLGDRFLPDAASAALEVFDRLPPLTWTADRRWRRRMARAFDDLADDLAAGHLPAPGCTAEVMALHLAVQDAPAHLEDFGAGDDHHSLPVYEDDYSYSHLPFHGHDVLMTLRAAFSGGAPDRPADAPTGGLRQAAWFAPFDDRNARDPRRGFRR